MSSLIDDIAVSAKASILVVDDEKSMREFMEIMLKKEGYGVSTASSGEEALDIFKSGSFDVVITDLKMGEMSGVELLKKLKEVDSSVIVILMTAYASVENAIDAMKSGAYDYFTKPFNIDDIKLHVSRAIEFQKTSKENIILKKDLKRMSGFKGLVGKSPKMASVYETIMSIASSSSTVLITGESGTGKELTARAIHDESSRSEGPFVAVNCGAIPESLMESELFGHEKGAFTGASNRKEGLAELADGGTLFLDEVTEMPLHLQVKLLRFVQERVFKRVGGVADISVDIRIVAASNRDVMSEVKAGKFREDLYYRLNVINLALPPLRERKEDLPVLIDHFISKHTEKNGKNIQGVSEEAFKALSVYNFQGNVRELENIIEGAIAVEKRSRIGLECLPEALSGAFNTVAIGDIDLDGGRLAGTVTIPDTGINLQEQVDSYERLIMEEALKKSGGVKKKAAELLGMTFRSFRYKADKYGLD